MSISVSSDSSLIRLKSRALVYRKLQTVSDRHYPLEQIQKACRNEEAERKRDNVVISVSLDR
ncbi:hypothetical protein OB236_22825 [Paenibacillus sp. WQ 127069]|uniref:Uncharacterized protein n=1 Tax=Paenibacillus baimaensis TaxID=2982185 RepID=A0ABT2ULG7_9BACL|nr:hypothetical protein [Paenibacillus sp. WQ 127069]